MTKVGLVAAVLGVVALVIYFQKDALIKQALKPRVTPTTSEESTGPEVVADNLNIPWEIRWLPDGRMLVTERPGRLLIIGPSTDAQDMQVIEVGGVVHVGEGGLLGLALHPNFSLNQQLYLYLTAREDDQLVNRVERYQLEDNTLTNREVIVEGILGNSNHDGGRLDFGPDGKLYITTGDAQNQALAQDKESLNGKILRVNDDGSNLEVYSYGHRNVQGLAWDSQGRLWATEHGPSGTASGFDEVNLIVPGANYGWPNIQGDETQPGMITPAMQSGADDTWAPAGMVIIGPPAGEAGNRLFFTGLRGATLYEAEINGGNLVNLKRHLTNQFGRLRALRLGPDNNLYLSTSNRDGRGTINLGDDKIIRLSFDTVLGQ